MKAIRDKRRLTKRDQMTILKAMNRGNVLLSQDDLLFIYDKRTKAVGIRDAYGSFFAMKGGDIIIQPARYLHLAPFPNEISEEAEGQKKLSKSNKK